MIQRFYVKRIATLFQLEPEWVLAKVRQVRYTAAKSTIPKHDSQDKYHKAQDFILFCMAGDLVVRTQVLEQLTPNEFLGETYQALVAQMAASDAVNQALLVAIQAPEQAQLLSRILMKTGDVGSDLSDCISTLRSYHKRHFVEQLKQQMAQAESRGHDEEVARLFGQIRDLLQNH